MNGKEIIDTIREFFEVLFADFASLWYWPLIFLGLMIVYAIIMLIIIRTSYESRILKNINRLNKYFVYKPYINDDNLVEFNQKMKKAPRVLRSAWQRYMLNREDGVKEYINVATCIDKPLRTSSIEKNIKGYTVFTTLILVLAFVTGLQFCTVSYAQASLSTVIFISLLMPILLLILYSVFILIFNAIKDDIYSVMYDNFPLFQYNLEKAVTKMPSYVDYEILFTSKEIKEGIPILQQYLEKRALVEQEQLEKARRDSVASEEYDFSDLGVDGSFLLEKAMKESESFIKIKRMLQEESNSIETEKQNYKKTYEENFKDMQRKLQASRENMDSLKKQQEESTNRIETNYIRKQLADEIKKQQQLEKEIEQATSKYTEEQASLEKEINSRSEEIEEKKAFVEQAMLLSFKHYANTLYKALLNKATDVTNERLAVLTQENNDLRALLTDLEGGEEDNYYDDNVNLLRPEDLSVNTPYNLSEEENKALEVINSDQANMSQDDASYNLDSLDNPYREATMPNDKDTHQEGEYASDNHDEGQNNADIYQEPIDNLSQEQVPQTVEQSEVLSSEEQVDALNEEPNKIKVDEDIQPARVNTNLHNKIDSESEQESDDNSQDLKSTSEESPEDAEEQLEIIQKEIEKENSKLKKEKEDLTSVLNSTLNKLMKKEEKKEDTKDVKRADNKEDTSKEKRTVNKKSATKSPAKSSAKSAKKSSTPKKTQTRRRQRDEDEEDSLSALNMEMAKLLNKTKKD